MDKLMPEKENIEGLIEPAMCEALNQLTDSIKQDFKPKSLDEVINEELADIDFSDVTFTDGLMSGVRIATKFISIEAITKHPFGIMPKYGEFEEE